MGALSRTGVNAHSTFFEIHFTKLAKQTNVQSGVSLCMLHPDVLCNKYIRMDFMNVMSDNFHHFLDEIYFLCPDPQINPCAINLNTECKVLPFIVV